MRGGVLIEVVKRFCYLSAAIKYTRQSNGQVFVPLYYREIEYIRRNAVVKSIFMCTTLREVEFEVHLGGV